MWAAPQLRTMQQAAAAAVPAVGAGVAHTCVDEQPRSAKYTVREVDAAAFMGPAGQLCGAPMKVTNSYILDHTIRRTEAHIEVLPPRDLPLLPGKSKKMRRVNDRKTLTALGIAALGRSGRGSQGQLGAATVVWRIETKCRGTFLCDRPTSPVDGCWCNLRVTYSATIQQVNDGVVLISITGLAPSDRRSWHSAARVWDPAALLARRDRKRSAQVAVIEQRGAELTNLRVAAVKQQRTSESAQASAGGGGAGEHAARGASTAWAGADDGSAPDLVGAAAPGPVDSGAPPTGDGLVTEIQAKRAALTAAKRAANPTFPRAVRDRIVAYAAQGFKASKIQGLLANDRDDLAGVPSAKYIQQAMDEARRRGHCGLPPYESLHSLCTGNALDGRVLLYMVSDPAVDLSDYADNYGVPAEALHMVVFATEQMISCALDADALGIDTKWRTRSDKGCVQGCLALKQRSKSNPGEDPRAEFAAGYRHHDSNLVCIALANLDNYWAHLFTLRAIKAALPCSDPNCKHPWKRVALDARGSYRMERACSAPRQRLKSSIVGIIDKAAYEARALIKEGIPIILCEFHVIKAMLEHWDTKLRLRNSHTLFVLLLSAKFVKRGRTEAQVNARWRVARDQVYLALDFANVDGVNKRAEAIAYFEAEWICERWRRWCTDILRAESDLWQHLPMTNNAQERQWILYVHYVCDHTQFNRIDDEALAVAADSELSLLNYCARRHRDSLLPGARTNIATKVHNRTTLALALVIRGAVRPVEGHAGIWMIKKGQASSKLVAFGFHQGTRKVETRVPGADREVCQPFFDYQRSEVVKKTGVRDFPDDVYLYDEETHCCECCDSMYTGAANGGCKHAMAVNLYKAYGDARIERAIVEIASNIRSRELHVPVALRVMELTNPDPMAVWRHLDKMAPAQDTPDEAATTAAPSNAVAAAAMDDAEIAELLDELRAEPEELETAGGGAAKRQKGSVKRPPTAYNLFYKKERVKILEREEKAPSFGEMNGLISEAWKKQTKRQWEAQNSVTDLAADPARTKPGPRPRLEAKRRHEWRSADKMRPRVGLKKWSSDSDAAGGGIARGGIASLHRVDAGNQGRSSQLAKAAARPSTSKSKRAAKPARRVSARQKLWVGMSSAEREAVETLGWTAASWDAREGRPFSRNWDRMRPVEHSAAKLLGFGEAAFRLVEGPATQEKAEEGGVVKRGGQIVF